MSALDAAALETGKTPNDIQRLESFHVIIAETAGAGFQSRKVLVHLVKGNPLGESVY
ncbi:hypothetical protein MUP38_01975 [Candidatus Bathyarchaeota archaeon]|nr:hypothetical protein [Candidatus Bathyarchaeota archaeon]